LGTAAAQTRHNRTITVDFQDEATCLRLLNDGKAFVEFVLAGVLALREGTCDETPFEE
jgi:hypothetical protein